MSGATPTRIPRVVWSYWDGSALPPLVEEAVAGWQAALEPRGWSVRLLRPDATELAAFPRPPARLSKQHAADLHRVRLVERYGGVWMDASILLRDPAYLDEWVAEADAAGVEMAAFEMGALACGGGAFPGVENWMFAAPPGSPLVAEWRREFEMAVAGGFHAYWRAKRAAWDLQPVWRLGSGPYLTQHACLQVAMQRRAKVTGARPRSYLHLRDATDARDGPFGPHAALSWDATRVAAAVTSADSPLVAGSRIVKLRRAERTAVQEQMAARDAAFAARLRAWKDEVFSSRPVWANVVVGAAALVGCGWVLAR